MRQHEWKKKQASAPMEPAPVAFGDLRPGPARWMVGHGAWALAAEALAALPQPVGLIGEQGLLKSYRKPLTQAWLEAGVDLQLLPIPDGTECHRYQMEGTLAAARSKGCKSLLGFGGGKAIDLAKWCAEELACPLVTVPTSAATCAAASSVVVVHDHEGAFVEVLDLKAPAGLCIVDLDALVDAPSELLAAGMADTLAKWLEWKAVEEAPRNFGTVSAWAAAEAAALTCERHGAEALRVPNSDAWEACVEACLLVSAQVSCLGRAPAAAAHSLANALTKQAAGRNLRHGAQVGLGLLWQENLLQPDLGWGRERVAAVLQSWGLPLMLPPGLDEGALLRDALDPSESVHGIDENIDPMRAKAALPTPTV